MGCRLSSEWAASMPASMPSLVATTQPMSTPRAAHFAARRRCKPPDARADERRCNIRHRGDAAATRGLADHPRTQDPGARGRGPLRARQAGRAAGGVRRDPRARGSRRDPPARGRARRSSGSVSARRRSSCSIASATRCWAPGGRICAGTIVDEHHIMYDVSDDRSRSVPPREEEGAHFTVFENCPIVEHHGARRASRPRLGRVHADPIDARADRDDVQRRRAVGRARRRGQAGARGDPLLAARHDARSGAGHRWATAPTTPSESPSQRLVTSTVAMLAKDPAMGGKQIAARLDISLSRLARVFKAEMGMSLVEYRNRLRLDRFARAARRGRRNCSRRRWRPASAATRSFTACSAPCVT